MKNLHLILGCALSLPAQLNAQAPVAAALPVSGQVDTTQPMNVVAPLPSNRAVLRAGTDVPVRLTEEITTQGKKLHVGQRVHLETAEAVVYQGVVVLPSGSPVIGEITDVVNKGMWGKSGHVGLRVLYLTVNGRQIRLSGAIDDKGVAGGVAAVAVSAIVFLPAGFFMTGTSAKLPVGTAFKAFLDEDVTLELAASAPPPLVIGASAQAVPAGTANVSAAIAVATPAPLGPTPVTAAVVGPPRAAANTPSGFCYDVPKGYVGTGSAEKPALTSATPACGSLGRK